MRQKFWLGASVTTMLLFPSAGRLCAATLHVGTNATARFPTIQAAIDAASPGDVVLVADGTYSGPGNRDINFRGKAITVRSANGPEHCLIDCQGQSRGVLFCSAEKADSVLDGFTILGGRADRGAGIHCTNMSSPTIAHCIVRGNEATQGGGGMYISAGSPVLTGCTFRANKASFHTVCDDERCRVTRACGGAILSQSSHPTIADCNFSDNLAADRGGALCIVFSVASLANCTFTSNDANDSGGAISCSEGSTVLLVECSFEENAADEDGGALSTVASMTTVRHSSFTGCRARGDDGGAIADIQGMLTLDDCVFQDNRAEEDGGALADFDSNSVAIDCVFMGNAAGEDGGAIYAWETSITLTGCTLLGNISRDDGGALYNRATKSVSLTGCLFRDNSARDNGGAIFSRYDASPQLFHCVLCGNTARSTGAAIYNRDSCNPRLINCLLFDNVTHGAGGAMCNRGDSNPTLVNCTISDNTAAVECGGILSWDGCSPQLTNCILWGNTNDDGTPEQAQLYGGMPRISSCCIQAYGGSLADTMSITQDPVFTVGPLGDYYLSQATAGQATTSPCCDAGAAVPEGVNLSGLTTRTDEVEDSGPVDIGYHYPVTAPAPGEAHDDGQLSLSCRQGRSRTFRGTLISFELCGAEADFGAGGASCPGISRPYRFF